MLPTDLPLYFVPIECAPSSIRIMPFSWHISSNGSSSTACPVKSTATTALVLSVIFSFTLAGSILYVFGLISAKTGFAPQYRAQFADAAKVIGVVITSSPSVTPAAIAAICNAAVPLLHTAAYFAPVRAHRRASSSSTLGPQVR